MSEPRTPTVLPPTTVPVLDDSNSLTLPWRRALENVGTSASGGMTQLTGDVLAGPGGGTQIAHLNTTGVTPGSYQNTNLTVGSDGRISFAEDGDAGGSSGIDPFALAALSTLDGALTVTAAYTLARPRTFSYTGDATGGPTTFNGSANVSTALTLATVNANVGTFGDSTHVAQITLDAKGRTTAAASVAISASGIGAVTTTGSPLIGQLAIFSSPTTITNGNLSGDVTTSGSLATILATVNSNVGTFGDASNIAQFTVNAKGLVTAASNVPISLPSGANPTASVGLAAVNGVATTFMRSDGAPALSQSIAPTWTGAHTWTPAVGATPIKVVTVAQTASFPVLDLSQTWNNAAIAFTAILLNVTNTNSLSTANLIDLQVGGASKFKVDRTGLVTTPLDIQGRNYFGTSIFLQSAGILQWSSDVFIVRRGAANLQFGAADAASPVAQTLTAQGSRSGTDTNVGGGNLTIQAGRGTGTGAISSMVLQSPVAAASGTTAQTQTTGATIKNGVTVLPTYTVATLPVASTVQGGRANVSDALTPAVLSIVVGGGLVYTPVYSDGTNWLVG